MMEGKDTLWNSDYLKVLATNFSSSFAFFLVTPLLSLYLSETFAASKDVIGLALSGYALTALLARPVTGRLVDIFPRKKVLLTALVFYVLLFGSYLILPSLAAFVFLRTLHGAPYGACTVANNTLVLNVLPASRRNEGIGYYGLSSNLSMAMAPSAGVFLYTVTGGYTYLFLAALSVAALGLLIASQVRVRETQSFACKECGSFLFFLRSRGWPLASSMLFLGCCYGALCNYVAVYSVEVLGQSQGTGTFFLLLAAGLIASRLKGSSALRAGKFSGHALRGLILSTVGYALFAAGAGTISYFGSALLIGLGNGMIWPAFQNMILRVAGINWQGTAISAILSAWSLGIGIGTCLGGIAVEYAGYVTMFIICALLHLLGTLFFVFWAEPCLRAMESNS